MVRKTKVRETASLIRNRGRTLVSILLIGVLAGASLLVALAGKPNGAAAAAKPEMITLLVKFRAGVSAQRAQEAVQGVAGEAHRTLDQIRTRVIKVPAAAAPAVMAALSKTAEVERVAAAVAVGAAGAPSDPEYGSQWALPAISWPDAYGAVPVTGSAKLFVLDTGVDGQHPDLASRVAGGMSFVEGNPLADPNGHRTALAGIAAAEVGNGAGIAGVAYCPVAVTSVQVLDSAGRGWDADVVPGILWAADQGADVILMGFSATTYSAALLDAVAYAQSRGTIVVAAAGNHGEVTTYPAALPGVVGVGAIDQQRAVLAGTSLGSSRVLAPGTGIYTTLPGGAYGSVGGASAAAAHAAGLAAMLKANGLGATTTAERLTGAVSPATGVSIGVIDVVKALTGNVGPTAPSEPTIPGPSGEPEYGIAAAPTIDTHPTDQTITYGVNATFTAVATGAKAPNARWQVSTNGGINWTDIAAVSPYGILTSKDTPADKKTTTTLTITKPPVSYSGYKYKVVFEHGGTTETNVATLTVTKATVTGSFTAANKVYDGGTAATIASRSLTGVIGGDDVSLSGGSATFSDKNVGVGKTVTGTGFGLAGADAGNYQLASTTLTTTASITKATVTGSFTADNKVYDGGTAATIASRSLTGVIGGDDVSLSGGSATFSDKNVGAGKTVTGTGFGLAGAAAGNYQLASTTLTTTADITPRTLVVTYTGVNKVYDGTTAATVTTSDDRVAGDVLTITRTAAFTDKNVGTAKTVNVTGVSLGGTDAGNYSVAATGSATADITKATVTGSFTADNKVYDGGTAATIASRSLTGVIGGDDVSLSGGSATFSDKNVGAGKTVTGTGFGLAGADAGNYQLASTTLTTTADITPRTLVVTYTGVNKVYDGNSNATVTTSDDRVAGDVLTINRTAAFTDKNVGNGKTVNVTGVSLAGTDAGNYSVAATGSATADITPRTLTVTYTGVNKVYDGTTAATVNTSDDRVLGDVLTITRTAAFTDKNVGAGKTVNVTGVSLSGADAGNYSVSATGSTTGSITPKLASVTPDPESKLWGTDDPTLTGTLSGFVTADGVTATYSRTTGEAIGEYTISATLSPAGELANYTITYNTAIFTITKRSTTLKYIGYTAQYSDPAGLSATLKDQTGTPVSGRTVLFTLGTQSISGVTDASGVAAPVLILTQAPGTSYTVTAAFAGDSLYLGSNSAPTSYTITREDARAEYTGALFVNTISATSGVATVPLRATIRDISAVLGDLAYDAYPGDILKANVTFYNGITKINATPLPLTLFDPADGKVAWAAYDWSVDIGSALSATYEITIKVNGYYVGELTGVLVTVSKPLGTEFITGGGYLTIGQSSAGTYAASAGSHMNFGFNVKYNKSGTKPQGSVNIIFRRSGKVYQIKTNSIQTLVVDPVTGKGTFYSKATLKDVTNPLIPIEVASNLRLDMRLTDGENVSGKKADTIGVALWTAEGKLLFSSNWSGTTTEEELLSGGNLVVH